MVGYQWVVERIIDALVMIYRVRMKNKLSFVLLFLNVLALINMNFSLLKKSLLVNELLIKLSKLQLISIYMK